jgi:hypothetical protein
MSLPPPCHYDFDYSNYLVEVSFCVWLTSLSIKSSWLTRRWQLTPVILATQEAEIRRIEVLSQSRQIVFETLSQQNPSQKRVRRVAQGVGPEFKPLCHKKIKVKK